VVRDVSLRVSFIRAARRAVLRHQTRSSPRCSPPLLPLAEQQNRKLENSLFPPLPLPTPPPPAPPPNPPPPGLFLPFPITFPLQGLFPTSLPPTFPILQLKILLPTDATTRSRSSTIWETRHRSGSRVPSATWRTRWREAARSEKERRWVGGRERGSWIERIPERLVGRKGRRKRAIKVSKIETR